MTRTRSFLKTSRCFIASFLASLFLCATAPPARADDAGVRRLVAALGRIDDAPEPLSALFTELQALEGLRLTSADAPAARVQLGDHQAFLPIADALRELTVHGGTVRLRFDRPVVLAMKRGVVALGTDVSLRVRSGPHDALIVDQTQGIKVGRSTSLTLPLRKLEVTTGADGKRVGRAEVMLGFIPKSITFDAPGADAPAPTTGLVGGLPAS